jgi:hypothetical protein
MRHRREILCRPLLPSGFPRLSRRAGAGAIDRRLPGFVPPVAGVLQERLGIFADGKRFALVVEAVVRAPELAGRPGDTDCGIGQGGNGGIPFGINGTCPRMFPLETPDSIVSRHGASDEKNPEPLAVTGVSGPCRTTSYALLVPEEESKVSDKPAWLVLV